MLTKHLRKTPLCNLAEFYFCKWIILLFGFQFVCWSRYRTRFFILSSIDILNKTQYSIEDIVLDNKYVHTKLLQQRSGGMALNKYIFGFVFVPRNGMGWQTNWFWRDFQKWRKSVFIKVFDQMLLEWSKNYPLSSCLDMCQTVIDKLNDAIILYIKCKLHYHQHGRMQFVCAKVSTGNCNLFCYRVTIHCCTSAWSTSPLEIHIFDSRSWKQTNDFLVLITLICKTKTSFEPYTSDSNPRYSTSTY